MKGRPRDIYSDNGTDFGDANNNLWKNDWQEPCFFDMNWIVWKCNLSSVSMVGLLVEKAYWCDQRASSSYTR